MITYVNPKMGYKARREELRAWGFGRCRCERCVEEERMALVNSGRKAAGGGGGEEPEQEREDRERRVQEELDDMVRELKANLGVV